MLYGLRAVVANGLCAHAQPPAHYCSTDTQQAVTMHSPLPTMPHPAAAPPPSSSHVHLCLEELHRCTSRLHQPIPLQTLCSPPLAL
jgi:hypothetical protein